MLPIIVASQALVILLLSLTHYAQHLIVSIMDQTVHSYNSQMPALRVMLFSVFTSCCYDCGIVVIHLYSNWFRLWN